MTTIPSFVSRKSLIHLIGCVTQTDTTNNNENSNTPTQRECHEHNHYGPSRFRKGLSSASTQVSI